MSEREKTSPNSPRRGPMGGHGPMGGGPGGPMMPGAKAKDFKGSMKKLLRYMAQYKFRVLLVVLAAVVSTVLMIFGPKVLGQATTEMFNGIMGKIAGTGEGINFVKIAQILLWLVCRQRGLFLSAGLADDRRIHESHL